MRHAWVIAGLMSSLFVLDANAALISVNWAADSTPDGLASGTLGALGVALVSTDGAVNGGDTFTADWPNRAGTTSRELRRSPAQTATRSTGSLGRKASPRSRSPADR